MSIDSSSDNRYAADPVIKYNYPYGGDAHSNALGYLKSFHERQNNINKIYKGGACAKTWQTFTDGVSENGYILIPQFDELNPVSPQSGSSASLKNNEIKIANQAGSIYDKFAFVGGKKARKNTKRKSRKSKNLKKTKRKSKNLKKTKRKSKNLKKIKRKSSK